ncbi:hypothetical protein HPB47_015329, partial [Ixodes persulcatus]
MNHVWAVTFKSEESKKLLAMCELVVKGRRCVVVDTSNKEVWMKLHWLLYNVADDDVAAALAPYGEVVEDAKEKWRVDGGVSIGTNTRTAVLRLKGGVTVDDTPHQQRECSVPRCNVCRRFGHEGAQCARTYAAATAPVGSDEKSDLFKDEADAEEAAAGSFDMSTSTAGAAPAYVGDEAASVEGAARGADVTLKGELRDCTAGEVTAPSTRHAKAHDDGNAEAVGDVPTDDTVASASGLTTKRTREDSAWTPPWQARRGGPPRRRPSGECASPRNRTFQWHYRRAARPPHSVCETGPDWDLGVYAAGSQSPPLRRDRAKAMRAE